MTISNPIKGAAPLKSFKIHATDIPFIVNLEDVANPYVVGTPSDFSVTQTVNGDTTYYFTVTINRVFEEFLSLISTIQLATYANTPCNACVVSTVPTISTSGGISFSFAIKNRDTGSADPTNYTGVQFVLRGSNGGI